MKTKGDLGEMKWKGDIGGKEGKGVQEGIKRNGRGTKEKLAPLTIKCA